MPISNDLDRALTANILGCASWEDATDYRNTAAHDRQRDDILRMVTEHRLSAVPAMIDSDIGAILGMPNFRAGPIAHVYQKIGEFIDGDGKDMEKASEIEQAFVILKLLRIYLEHGAEWQIHASAELERAVVAMKAAGR